MSSSVILPQIADDKVLLQVLCNFDTIRYLRPSILLHYYFAFPNSKRSKLGAFAHHVNHPLCSRCSQFDYLVPAACKPSKLQHI
jgi:hypothetical protein